MIDYKLIDKYPTPMYVFDINKLKDRIDYLKSKLINCNIVYAVKANTFIPKEIENDIDRFEICSPGEFDICNRLKINHDKMVISGVYKDEVTIDNMMKNYEIGKYTIESLEQFKLLEKLSKKYKKKIHVLVRLTSHNQFGVTEEEVKYIIKHCKNIIIDGIEYFSGTQKTSLKKVEKEVLYIKEFVSSIEDEFNIEIKEIEYGPGLPVHYFQDEEFNEDEFLSEVNRLLDILKDKKLLLEIGRGIAASCGYYITKIVDMKTNKNGNYVIVDGGINHLVYYGQTMAMRIPHYDLYPQRTSEIKTYNIYGSLCTINDIIVKNISTNELKLGDKFIFKNVGAYSSTEGISLFLSRNLPSVLLFKDNKFIVVRNNINTSDINYPNY
jgi:diaminopimelate decarboxylase